MTPVTVSSAINIVEDRSADRDDFSVKVSGGDAQAFMDRLHVARVMSDGPIDYEALARSVRRMPRAPEPPVFGAGSPFGI